MLSERNGCWIVVRQSLAQTSILVVQSNTLNSTPYNDSVRQNPIRNRSKIARVIPSDHVNILAAAAEANAASLGILTSLDTFARPYGPTEASCFVDLACSYQASFSVNDCLFG